MASSSRGGGPPSTANGGVANGQGGSASYSAHQKNENGLVLILVGIVLVFMVCHFCRFILTFSRVRYQVFWFLIC